MQVEAFCHLNVGMALRTVFDAVQALDRCWDQADLKNQAMQSLKELLTLCGKHEKAELHALASFAEKLFIDMNYHQFISLFVPIERQYLRAVTDSDILIAQEDRVEAAAAKIPVVLVLENIRSAFNLGSIWRTAECLGVEKIFLLGYTPSPENQKVARAAMGTEDFVPWEWFPHREQLFLQLRASGYFLIASETSPSAIKLDQMQIKHEKIALVFGNERYGLEAETLQSCDTYLEIPMYGKKSSLNVSVAAGIVIFEVRRQLQTNGFI